jgi:multicomponent Na+:H+ antiporter subunit B
MSRPFESVMLRVVLAPLLAVLHLFGVYVLIHGHYGPGGGFVAGILVAAAMILPRLVGWPPERLLLSARGAAVTAVAGILLFAALGAASLGAGESFLDYAALPVGGTVPARRSMGILLIEIGVAFAVAGSMLALFYALTGKSGEAHRP